MFPGGQNALVLMSRVKQPLVFKSCFMLEDPFHEAASDLAHLSLVSFPLSVLTVFSSPLHGAQLNSFIVFIKTMDTSMYVRDLDKDDNTVLASLPYAS